MSKTNDDHDDDYEINDKNFKIKSNNEKYSIETNSYICKLLPLHMIAYKDDYQPDLIVDLDFSEQTELEISRVTLHVVYNNTKEIYEIISGHKRYADIIRTCNNQDLLIPCIIEIDVPNQINRIKIPTENYRDTSRDEKEIIRNIIYLNNSGLSSEKIAKHLFIEEDYINEVLKKHNADKFEQVEKNDLIINKRGKNDK